MLLNWNLHWSSSKNVCLGWCLRCGYSVASCRAMNSVSLLSWHTTYIYVTLWGEPNDIYIYIYIHMSQPSWRILEQFCSLLICILAEFCFAVDSWRSGLHCVATVAPSLPPQPFRRAPLLYVNTYQLRTFCSLQIRFQTQHVLFMARLEKELREAWISILAYETSRTVDQKVFSGVL